MNLIFDGNEGISKDVLKDMERSAVMCLEHENVRPDDTDQMEISVTFTDSSHIRDINREFRGVDDVTDVLSFPQFESPDDIPSDVHISLGDVVICVEKALSQAKEFGHSEERELVYLFVHSMFHLLGHDHMTEQEKAKMRDAEESVMSCIGLERK